MDLDIRPIGEDELDRYFRAMGSAFSEAISAEHLRLERLVVELDRTLAVFDGPDIVGSTLAYSMELTIPGGTAPMAGVSGVAVVPTHRRRGILTELMRRQLQDVHHREEAVAGLWASEGSIYQRFGYGLATLHARFEIEQARTAFARPLLPDPGRLRLVERDEALRAMPLVYESIRPRVPGMLGRPPEWWEIVFSDLEEHRHGAGEHLYVVHEIGGIADGYLAYRVKQNWDDGGPSGEAMIHELVVEDPAARGALWSFALNLDLVKTISSWRHEADDPILYMLAEPRRLRLELSDALWLRLVDVDAALRLRTYAGEGRLALAVRDSLCPWNEGTYELDAGPGEAVVRRTASGMDEPDLRMDAADLAAVYLGGTTFERLRRAGRVEASSDEVLARADTLFRTPRAPWCPHIF